MSQPQPHDTDAILGGKNPPPLQAMVLGGLAGVKQRLASTSMPQRLQALESATLYGDDGIELAIKALLDENLEIQRLAEKLLQFDFGRAGEKALLENVSPQRIHAIYNPFIEWEQRSYQPEVGISNPEYITYNIQFSNSHRGFGHTEYFRYLVKDPNIANLRSLIIQIDSLLHQGIQSVNPLIEIMQPILVDRVAPNLKSLGICYEAEGKACELTDPIVEREMQDLFMAIVSKPIVRELRYLALRIVTLGKGDYLGWAHEDDVNKVALYKR
jgi:hypothetical protein